MHPLTGGPYRQPHSAYSRSVLVNIYRGVSLTRGKYQARLWLKVLPLGMRFCQPMKAGQALLITSCIGTLTKPPHTRT
jgi:hypothetical protein